jgi:hypothetical protein
MVRGPAIVAALLLVTSCLVGPAGVAQATTGGASDVITLETHSPVTSASACTTRVFRQCTLER